MRVTTPNFLQETVVQTGFEGQILRGKTLYGRCPSGAKAPANLSAVMYGLKPAPFIRRSFLQGKSS